MKKLSKACLSLLVIPLILSIVGICTFAASEQEETAATQTEKSALIENGDFVSYDSSTKNKLMLCASADSTSNTENAAKSIAYTSTSAGDEEFVTVTWKAFGEVITEKWAKSDSTIPVPPVAMQSNDFYRFKCSPKIEATAVTGDVTYVIEETINFTIKANITLYADFVYNLYIPKTAGDSELFNWARIDRLDSNGIYRGEQFSLKDNKNIEVKTIEGVEYYVVTQRIFAQEGDSKYRLALGYDGYSGLSVYTLDFSIPDYVKKVNELDYTSEAKAMVTSALEYIKTASNYYAIQNGNTPKYTDENKPVISGTALTVEPSKASEEIAKVFYGAALNLNESINFRFYLYENFEGSVSFTYKKNTVPQTVTVKYEDIKNNTATVDGKSLVYFDVELRAVDLRTTINMKLESGAQYDYTLSNYAFSAKSSDDQYLKDLIDALWVYTVKSRAYYVSSSSDSPAVDFSIDGAVITDAEYEILINAESQRNAAAAIKNALLTKTGEELDIVTSSTGKYAIILNVLNTPSKEFDFNVYVDGHNLVINSSFASFIDGGVRDFLQEYISSRSKSYDFSETFSEKYSTDRIYYSDFGAYGIDMTEIPTAFKNVSTWYGSDWENTVRPTLTNDFYNMRAAHVFANETGRHTVYADEGATYYISETWDYEAGAPLTIPIKTNVVWGNAHIVIDDSHLPGYSLTDGQLENHELRDKYAYYWNKITAGISDSASKYVEWNRYEAQGSAHVFTVETENDLLTIDTQNNAELLASLTANGPLDSTSTKIDLGLNYPAMLIIRDSSHNVYRRSGYSSWRGTAQHELVVIDEYGNIDPETKLQFSYQKVTKIEVYRLDDKPVTVTGGSATTLASRIDNYLYNYQQNSKTYAYVMDGVLNRGIRVTRPNTVISGLNHSVVGEISINEYWNEKMIGSAYYGFFTAKYTSDVTFKDCTLQGRRCYYKNAIYDSMADVYGTNTGTSGTYDLDVEYVNRIKFDGCVQSNFFISVDSNNNITPVPESEITDSSYVMSMDNLPNTFTYTGKDGISHSFNPQMHWGTGGTNYCKNMSYVNSKISRFDAHCGLYNGEIIGSSVNAISVVGAGTMRVEDTTYYSTNEAGNTIVTLRSDYGSTWDGDVIFKDVTVRENQTKADIEALKDNPYKNVPSFTALIGHSYSNWYFGYESVFPNVTIDNINYLYKDGTEITSEERGMVQFALSGVKSENWNVVRYSFVQEPNLHLSETTKSINKIGTTTVLDGLYPACYAYVNEYNDSFVDFTNGLIPYYSDSAKPTSGFTIKDEDGDGYIDGIKDAPYTEDIANSLKYKNINPIKPPEYVKVLGNDGGYDFTGILEEFKNGTTFSRYNSAGSRLDYVDVTFFDNTEIIENTHTHNITTHNAKAPTCTEAGWNAYETCSLCDYTTYAEIPALGHETTHYNSKTPTCTEVGWDAYVECSRCDYTTYEEKAALGHDISTHEAKAATCTEFGWNAYETCSRCDHSTYVEEAALGHDISTHEAKAATCTESGWNAYETCSRCDHSTYAEEAALGHNLEHHEAKNPTQTEIGWMEYDACTRCDYSTYIELPTIPDRDIRDEDTPTVDN